ncbi:hypothetical protein HYH02_001581 [Chlamydomonas schloesseri]|uniref:Guanylate cyclase domain-containing protein n=1 Tax=Chlamydomonas schloesseri TaxID=2026947 RepID=A0A835WSW3_9CHLO|nr:hypothetical protein HYH02_001581 [Chlamydomonas schloesseri]|eukprot:KAG2453357.1 hypothetical protein HYH02_001581 [Chlamydomonas schloesseri]
MKSRRTAARHWPGRAAVVLALLLRLASANSFFVDSCLQQVVPRLVSGCESIHAREQGSSNSSFLSPLTLLAAISSCLDSGVSKTVSIMAPSLSVSSYIGALNFTAALNYALPSINMTLVPIAVWGRTLAQSAGVRPQLLGLEDNATMPEDYDIWMVDPVALADLYAAGMTLDLSQVVLDPLYKDQIAFHQIHQLFRGGVVVAEGTVSALPFGGLIYQMYYRRDVLAKHGLDVPATWDEFLDVARIVNGTDMNGDGVPDYGVCLQRPRYCFNGFNLASIWSSFVQSRGTRQGAFFDPDTMMPLTNNSAFRTAMELWVALRDYGPPDESTAQCLPFNMQFVRGRCALTLSWGYQLKANIFLPFSMVRDKVSVALLPGSTHVLDRSTGELVLCTSRAVCPYASELPIPTPENSSISTNTTNSTHSKNRVTYIQTGVDETGRPTRLVNRAPFLALATVSAAINIHAPVAIQSLLLAVLSYMSSRNVSWDLVTSPHTEMAPYRYEHFDPANLDMWVKRGYPRAIISEYLQVMKAQVDSENVMLEVRTPDAYAYRRMMDVFATLVSERAMDVPVAVAQMSKELQGIFGRNNPRFNLIRHLYRYSIGIISEGGPPPSPSGAAVQPSGSDEGSVNVVAITVPVVLVALVAALGAVAAYAELQRRRRRARRSSHKGHPGVGENTTLIVSDVEGSTVLWEVIEASVMDTAFDLHHDCMRRTAVRFNGYESQTEGDSFIISFHHPDDALQFSLAVQQALLEEPWPKELLEHEMGRPVWLARTATEVPLELPFEPLAGTTGPAATVAQPVSVQPQPQQPHPHGPQHHLSQRVQYGGHGPRSTGGVSDGVPYTASRLGTPSAADIMAGPAPAAPAPAAPASPWAPGPGGSGRGLAGGSSRMSSLRRILARQGSSKRRVHSSNGTPDGTAGAAGVDAAVAAVFASHDTGGGSTSGAATSDAIPGDMSPPGPALGGRGAATAAPPAPRLVTVGDALRAMWREVSVANDPWGGSGAAAGGAAMRWQGMKAALSLRLPAATPRSASRQRPSASGISIGGAASGGSGPTSPLQAGSPRSVSARDGSHLGGGSGGTGGTGSRRRMAAAAAAVGLAAAGPVAEARLPAASDGGGSSDEGGTEEEAARLVGITIEGGNDSSGEEQEEAGQARTRHGDDPGDMSGSQQSLARRVQSESANKSRLAQVAGSTFLAQRALSGTAGAGVRARRRAATAAAPAEAAAAAAAAAAARVGPMAISSALGAADGADGAGAGTVAPAAAAASSSKAHSGALLLGALPGAGGADRAGEATGTSAHSFSGSRLGSKTFGRQLLSALVDMAFGPGGEQGAPSGTHRATEDSYAEGRTGGAAATAGQVRSANSTAASSRRTTLGGSTAPAPALSAAPAPTASQALASAPGIMGGNSSRAYSMARSEGPPSYGAGRLAPGGGVGGGGSGVDATVVSAEQCTLVRRGLAVRIGMHTGVRRATDLVYSDVAARWKYSGEVLAAAKAVSDAANGGEVLLSRATLKRLSPELFTRKAMCLLYLGRHVLRGGDPAATAATPAAPGGLAASAITTAAAGEGPAAAVAAAAAPPPAPGSVADLYGAYNARLMGRMGLYRPPRTAVCTGLSSLDAPLGRVAYVLLVSPGLSDMAAHSDGCSEVVLEAQATLGSIAADQLQACSGVPAARVAGLGAGAGAGGTGGGGGGGADMLQAASSAGVVGGGAAGTVVGVFANPYQGILFALQAQEDLLNHHWSSELLAHEQFEEIVMPAAAAAAIMGEESRHKPPPATSPQPGQLPPSPRGGRGSAATSGYPMELHGLAGASGVGIGGRWQSGSGRRSQTGVGQPTDGEASSAAEAVPCDGRSSAQAQTPRGSQRRTPSRGKLFGLLGLSSAGGGGGGSPATPTEQADCGGDAHSRRRRSPGTSFDGNGGGGGKTAAAATSAMMAPGTVMPASPLPPVPPSSGQGPGPDAAAATTPPVQESSAGEGGYAVQCRQPGTPRAVASAAAAATCFVRASAPIESSPSGDTHAPAAAAPLALAHASSFSSTDVAAVPAPATSSSAAADGDQPHSVGQHTPHTPSRLQSLAAGVMVAAATNSGSTSSPVPAALVAATAAAAPTPMAAGSARSPLSVTTATAGPSTGDGPHGPDVPERNSAAAHATLDPWTGTAPQRTASHTTTATPMQSIWTTGPAPMLMDAWEATPRPVVVGGASPSAEAVEPVHALAQPAAPDAPKPLPLSGTPPAASIHSNLRLAPELCMHAEAGSACPPTAPMHQPWPQPAAAGLPPLSEHSPMPDTDASVTPAGPHGLPTRAAAAIPAYGAAGGGGAPLVLFRGPRVKAAITYGVFKASLDPASGRIRYDGKPASQAAKIVSYAAVGMVVASVEAVDAGHAEEQEMLANPTLDGAGAHGPRSYHGAATPRADIASNNGLIAAHGHSDAGTGTLGGSGGAVAAALGPISMQSPHSPHSRGHSASLRLPSMELNAAAAAAAAAVAAHFDAADLVCDDPEGPNAAVAAAAAAAAAALLNLAPDGGGVLARSRSVSLDIAGVRRGLGLGVGGSVHGGSTASAAAAAAAAAAATTIVTKDGGAAAAMTRSDSIAALAARLSPTASATGRPRHQQQQQQQQQYHHHHSAATGGAMLPATVVHQQHQPHQQQAAPSTWKMQRHPHYPHHAHSANPHPHPYKSHSLASMSQRPGSDFELDPDYRSSNSGPMAPPEGRLIVGASAAVATAVGTPGNDNGATACRGSGSGSSTPQSSPSISFQYAASLAVSALAGDRAAAGMQQAAARRVAAASGGGTCGGGGGGCGSGSGSISVGGLVAAAGLSPLAKADSRQASRSGTRTMSNLNPDSRQASRTGLQRPNSILAVTGTAPVLSPDGSRHGATRPSSVAGTWTTPAPAAAAWMLMPPSPRSRSPLFSDTEGDSDDAPGGQLSAGEGSAPPATFSNAGASPAHGSALAAPAAAANAPATGTSTSGPLSGRPPRPRAVPTSAARGGGEVPDAAAVALAVTAAGAVVGGAAALAASPPEPFRTDTAQVGLSEPGADLDAMLPPPPDLQPPAVAGRSQAASGSASPAVGSPEPAPTEHPEGPSARGLPDNASATSPQMVRPAALPSISPPKASEALLHRGFRSASLGAASAAAINAAAAAAVASGSSRVPQDPAHRPPSPGSSIAAAAVGPSRLTRNASASSATLARSSGGGGGLLPTALRHASERMVVVSPGGLNAAAASAARPLAPSLPTLPTLGESPGDTGPAPVIAFMPAAPAAAAAAATDTAWPALSGVSVSALGNTAPHGGPRTGGSAYTVMGAGESNSGGVSSTGTGTTGGESGPVLLAPSAPAPGGRAVVTSPRRAGSMGSGVHVSRNNMLTRAPLHLHQHQHQQPSTALPGTAGARLNRPGAGEGGASAAAAAAALGGGGTRAWSSAATTTAPPASGGWASHPGSRASSRVASRKTLRSGAAGMVAAPAAPVARGSAAPAAPASVPAVGGLPPAARPAAGPGAVAAMPWSAQQQQQPAAGPPSGGVSYHTNSCAPPAHRSGSHANVVMPPTYPGPALYGTTSGRAFPLYQPPQMQSSQRLAHAVSPAGAATGGLVPGGPSSAAGPLSGSGAGLRPYPVPASVVLAAGSGSIVGASMAAGAGGAPQWHPEVAQSVRLSHPLESVGMDEVTMIPVALRKRANSQPLVVYLCRFASGQRAAEVQQRLVSMGRGNPTAAAAAATAAVNAAAARKAAAHAAAAVDVDNITGAAPAAGALASDAADGLLGPMSELTTLASPVPPGPSQRTGERSKLTASMAALFSGSGGGPRSLGSAGNRGLISATADGNAREPQAAVSLRRTSLTSRRPLPSELGRRSAGVVFRIEADAGAAAGAAKAPGAELLTAAPPNVAALAAQAAAPVPTGPGAPSRGGGFMRRFRRASLDMTGQLAARKRQGRGSVHGTVEHVGEARTMSVKRVQRGTASGVTNASGPLHMLLPPGVRATAGSSAISAALPQLPHPVAPQVASSQHAHSPYSTSSMLWHGSGAPVPGPLSGMSLPASSVAGPVAVAMAVGPGAGAGGPDGGGTPTGSRGPPVYPAAAAAPGQAHGVSAHPLHEVRSLAPWVPGSNYGASTPDETTGSAAVSHPGAAASGSLTLSFPTAAGAGSVGSTTPGQCGSGVSLAGLPSSMQHPDSAMPGSCGAIAAPPPTAATAAGQALGGGSSAIIGGAGGASASSSQHIFVLGQQSGSNVVLPSVGGGPASAVLGPAAGHPADPESAAAAAVTASSSSLHHWQLQQLWQEHSGLSAGGAGSGATGAVYVMLPGAGIRTTGGRLPPQMSMMTTPTVEEHEDFIE